MKRHALALIALLAACQQPASDGYTFEGAEYAREQVVVRVVTHASLTELRHAANAAGARDDGRELMAWATLSGDRTSCTIHVVDPARVYAPEWLGHELAHCLYGRWHR